MKNTPILPIAARCAMLCAVLCAVWTIVACGQVTFYEYTCTNGRAVVATTTSQNTERCAVCDDGYHQVGDFCQVNTYTCIGGTTEADGTAGGMHNDQLCAVCDDGYHLDGNLCVINTYTCRNGTHASDGTAGTHSDEICTACAFGFILSASRQCRPVLAAVQNVVDGDALQLDGAFSVTTAVVGSATYLFAAGSVNSGISVFSVGSGGMLTPVQNVADTAPDANTPDTDTLQLDGAFSVTTAVVGNATYLFAAGIIDDGVSVFSVGSDGVLTSVDNVDDADAGALQLDGATSVATAVVGDATYLFVAGRDDDGVSVFSVGSGGALTSVDNIDDAEDAELKLDDAISVATAVVGGATYLFVAGNLDDGVSVFSVGVDGALTSVQNVADTTSGAGALQLDGAASVTTAVVGADTYLFVAGHADDGVSVFSVGSGGALTSVGNVIDTAPAGGTSDVDTLQLDGAASVTVAAVGADTYLFVAGHADDGVSVFSVGSGGALTPVGNVVDTVPAGGALDADTLQLDGAASVAVATVGDTAYLFVAGYFDDGISVFAIGE